MSATKRIYLSITFIAIYSVCCFIALYLGNYLTSIIDLIIIIINLYLIHRSFNDIKDEAILEWQYNSMFK